MKRNWETITYSKQNVLRLPHVFRLTAVLQLHGVRAVLMCETRFLFIFLPQPSDVWSTFTTIKTSNVWWFDAASHSLCTSERFPLCCFLLQDGHVSLQLYVITAFLFVKYFWHNPHLLLKTLYTLKYDSIIVCRAWIESIAPRCYFLNHVA